jgi:2-desacetyl-2-hydroxyethyl bacteriochlorophyllide A dehydrogenase
MKAVVFEEVGKWSFRNDYPDPSCGPNEVVVRVRSCGICGTDHHILKGEFIQQFPLIPGHEFSGEIVEAGKDVKYFRSGDRVSVHPNIYCGECYFCQHEQDNHCLNLNGYGTTRDGGFAEYAVVSAANCYAVSESLSFQEAAFVEPVACVVHGLNRMRIFPGDDVLLFGAGPIGLLLLQALRHGGASKVVAVDKQVNRLSVAKSLGAYATVQAGPDQQAELNSYAPHGYSIVIDATGVPAVVQQAFQYIKPYGQYLQFGVTPPDATIQIKPYDVYRQDWNVIGSFALLSDFHPAIAWLESGAIDVKSLVSHFLPLEDFAKGLELSGGSGQALKVQHAVF